MNLIERVTATQATIDDFLFKPFEWGTADCGQLAGSHLERLNIAAPKPRNYSTELGAKRALSDLGATSMEDLCDALGLERIAPAAAVVGDLLGFPGGTEEDQWTALGVHTGGDKLIGFADSGNGDGVRCEWGPVSIATVAWRVG